MKIQLIIVTTSLVLALACGASHPPPTQQMADVQSANRSATELGAQKNPRAALHLKLAEEQLDEARKAIANDDNERATSLLMRAKADAELAVALTREDSAKTQASKAVDQANAQTTNAQLGATP